MKVKMLYFAVFSMLILAIACSKDKLESIPQLKLKSVNTLTMGRQDVLEILLDVRDKEGDVTDSALIVKEILNELQKNEPQQFTNLDYPIPPHPSTTKMEMGITFSRQDPGVPVGDPFTPENDTVVFHIKVRDKAGHYSEVLTTPKIVILKD